MSGAVELLVMSYAIFNVSLYYGYGEDSEGWLRESIIGGLTGSLFSYLTLRPFVYQSRTFRHPSGRNTP